MAPNKEFDTVDHEQLDRDMNACFPEYGFETRPSTNHPLSVRIVASYEMSDTKDEE